MRALAPAPAVIGADIGSDTAREPCPSAGSTGTTKMSSPRLRAPSVTRDTWWAARRLARVGKAVRCRPRFNSRYPLPPRVWAELVRGRPRLFDSSPEVLQENCHREVLRPGPAGRNTSIPLQREYKPQSTSTSTRHRLDLVRGNGHPAMPVIGVRRCALACANRIMRGARKHDWSCASCAFGIDCCVVFVVKDLEDAVVSLRCVGRLCLRRRRPLRGLRCPGPRGRSRLCDAPAGADQIIRARKHDWSRASCAFGITDY